MLLFTGKMLWIVDSGHCAPKLLVVFLGWVWTPSLQGKMPSVQRKCPDKSTFQVFWILLLLLSPFVGDSSLKSYTWYVPHASESAGEKTATGVCLVKIVEILTAGIICSYKTLQLKLAFSPFLLFCLLFCHYKKKLFCHWKVWISIFMFHVRNKKKSLDPLY